MSRNEMKDWIVMMLAIGLIILLFVITLGDFYNAIQTNRPPDKDFITLLSMAITGIVVLFLEKMQQIKLKKHRNHKYENIR